MSLTTSESTDIETSFSLSMIIKRLSGDTLIYGLGSVLAQAISFFLLPLYTTVLAPAEYGMVDILLTMNLIFFVIAKLGIDSGIAIIFQHDDQDTHKRMISSNLFFQLTWASIFSCILLLSANTVNDLLFNHTLPTVLIMMSFLLLPLQCLVDFTLNLHKWKREPVHYILISVGLTACTAIITAWFLLIVHIGVIGIFLGMLISNILFAIFGIYSILKYLTWTFAWDDVKSCLGLGIPFALSGILIYLSPNINRLFLVSYVGLTGTGIFAAALKISYIGVFIASTFQFAYLPFALSIQKSPDAKRVYALVGRYFPLVMIVVISLLLISAPLLISLLLRQPEYATSYQFIGPLLLAMWFQAIRFPFIIGLTISKKTKYYLIASAFATGVNVILNICMIPTWGVQGAVWAIVFGECAMTIGLFFLNQKFYFVSYEVKPIVLLVIYYFGLMISLKMIMDSPIAQNWIIFLGVGLLFIAMTIFGSGAIKREEFRIGIRYIKNR